MALRPFLALEMVALLAWSPASTSPAVLGVVVEADRVRLNTGAVSLGATVYDGDRFSTESGGILLLRGDAAMLELAGESTVVLRRAANGTRGDEAELSKGSLMFSADRATAVEIIASEAHVKPSADDRTVAQVSLTDPQELRIYARRGALQFSYRWETETIAEGAAYRVILDPPQSQDNPKKNGPVKAARHRNAFLFVAITGGAATASAVILYENRGHKRTESPERP